MYYIPEPLNPKKDLGRFSATCFTYLWVMIAAVFIYVFVAFFVIMPGQGMDIQKTQDIVTKFMEKDGGAYILASCLGVLTFTVSRGKQLFKYDLRRKGRKMTPKVFFYMICFLLFAQMFTAVVNQMMQAIMQLFNLDLSSMESGGGGSETLTMLIYSSLMAPVTEEIIFRGAGLRGLEKHGKIFAILLTAILFGLFHENLYQFYFASLIGLGFGYIA